MKKIISALVILLVLPTILATNLQIEKQSTNEIMIVGIDQPTSFELKVKNLGTSDSFEFYNLLGFNMFPKGTTYIEQGETKNIQLTISPIGELKSRGYYTLSYYIKGGNSPEVTKQLTFKIVELEEILRIGTEEINPESNSLNLYIQNKGNFNFTNMKVEFSSQFFKLDKTITLEPYGKEEFTIQLDKEDFKKITAGFYTLTAEIKTGDKQAEIEGIIKFSENENVVTTKKDYGLIIHTQILKKVNEGNVIATSETIFKKNIFSRLFTSFNPEPDFVERQKATIYYTWNRQIKPGETLEIVMKTNWVFPLLVILLIVAIVIFAKQYNGTNLAMRKRVTFVQAKGGEFALKVTIFIKVKTYVERVSIIDRLPPLVKIHERFGAEQPTRVNEKTRRIEWTFDKLEQGETRVLTYIIYSKIGLLGKFALPSATAIFEKDSKIKEESSNRAFFVAEQKFRRTKNDEENERF